MEVAVEVNAKVLAGRPACFQAGKAIYEDQDTPDQDKPDQDQLD